MFTLSSVLLCSVSNAQTYKQVEQASLNSQHAAVLARCSESEARCAALEAESKVWAREREESVARMKAVGREHERMTALQQRQEAELEELLDKHSQLRSNNRSLEGQHRELEARYTHTHAIKIILSTYSTKLLSGKYFCHYNNRNSE